MSEDDYSPDELLSALIALGNMARRGETRIPYALVSNRPGLARLINEGGDRLLMFCVAKLVSYHEEEKRKRNRRSDPATIEQDAEIYRLRNEDPRRWSWKRLGRHFGMTEGGARKAYNRHEQNEKRTN